ncbi:hypothetical protein R3P38DRAFT_927471 [Favolaschia claudopus]|uniref:F-box domain-containing protein n=1 Tax=Favolaschia claudopus TaxID=2862362 RepID=A0AAW0BNQ0_9AGAR
MNNTAAAAGAHRNFCDISQCVLEYLLPADIHSLCYTCRRLNQLVVNVLLLKNGVTDPTMQCHIRLDGPSAATGPSALVALQNALYVPKIPNLSVTFMRTFDTTPISRNVRRCIRVLQKHRQSIDRVSIAFVEDEKHMYSDPRLLAKQGKGYPLNTDLLALLDCVAQDLPNLKSLQVSTGWDFDGVYLLEGFPRSVIGLRPVFLSSFSSKLRQTLSSKPRSPPITFLIDTPLLVLPPLNKYTHTVLSSRAITTLRLRMLIAPDDWVLLLSEIADTVPRLLHLSILGIRLPASVLVTLLYRFSKLETLTTDSSPQFPEGPSFRAIAPAPNLTRPPRLRSHQLLSFLVSNHPLKHLTTLSTRPEHLSSLLRPHVPLRSLTSLTVLLTLLDLTTPPTVPLLCTLSARLRATHPSLPLHLDIAFKLPLNSAPETHMCRVLDAAVVHGAGWAEAFGPFVKLQVKDYKLDMRKGGRGGGAVLARWVGVFPGLKELELSVAGVDANGLGVDAGKEKEALKAAVREIQRVSPNVQAVRVEDADGRALSFCEDEDIGKSSPFLDLPDDILLVIMNLLSPAELYHLSRLSRRLHLLALPCYFAANGMPDPAQSCDFRLVNLSGGADVLSALNSSLPFFASSSSSPSLSPSSSWKCYLQGRRIGEVRCRFKPRGHISCYLSNIQRLTSFFETLEGVKRVELALAGEFDEHCLVNEQVVTRWRETFGALMDVMLVKGCRELVVYGTPYLPLSPPKSWLKSVLELDSLWRPRGAAAPSQLHSFSFHPSNVNPTHEAGIRWLFSFLCGSQLTRLSLSITSECLLDVIRQQNFPNLVELEIPASSPSLDVELIGLLCELRNLRYLALPPRGTKYISISRGPVPAFTHLKVLAASTAFIMHFLCEQDTTATNFLPVLDRLEIRISTMSAPHPEVTVAQTLRTFRLSRAEGAALPMIVLDLNAKSTRWTAKQFNAWLTDEGFRKVMGEAPPWPEAAGMVSGLVVPWPSMSVWRNFRVVKARMNESEDAGILQTLLPRFPKLRELGVDDGAGKGQMVPEVEGGLVRRILRMCPRLKRVRFNGAEVYSNE